MNGGKSRPTPDRTADFEWLSLDEGEEIVWSGGPDKRTLVPTFLVGIPLSIVLVGVFIIVGAYLRVTNTDYVVTNRGLYRKTGVLSRNVQRIDFEKVQNISYNQTALGNYFGYGNVDVSTAGGAGVEMRFQAVPNPREVQGLISEHLERGPGADRTGGEGSGRTKEDVLAEILEELRAIRTAVDESPAAISHTDEDRDDPTRR